MKLTATKSGIRLIPKTKRESFLPEDEKWLTKHSEVQLGKFIGEGTQGVVYTVKGKPSLVVKIPGGFDDIKTENELSYKQCTTRRNLYTEMENIEKFDKEELIIPSKIITVKNKHGVSFLGIVRPRVKTITDYTKTPSKLSTLTDVEIEQLRQKVINLSEKGILISDGLQVGRDRVGRIQLYDVGGVEKHGSSRQDVEYAFEINNDEWISFLYILGKFTDNCKVALKKYGRIEE